jgi:DNA-binding NarL/FixJ family response regulator
MSDRVRLVVVDDHPIFRAGVIHTLKLTKRFDVVGEGSTADQAVRMAKEQEPDVVLLDISMPGGGLEAAATIARMCPKVRIVILTASELEDSVAASLQAGVQAYILKGTCGTELARVIEAVCNGESYVSPDLAARLFVQQRQKARANHSDPKDPLSDLTVREREIIEQVSNGLTNKEIARNLDLSEKTIKHYMSNIMQKLQVRNRVEAVLQIRGKLQ